MDTTKKQRIVFIRKFGIGAIMLLAFGLMVLMLHRRAEAPVLTVVRNSMPSCKTRTITITSSKLTAAREDLPTFQMPVGGRALLPLLYTISNTPLSTLERVYDDPNVDDGFELKFHFHAPGEKTVVVRNTYVPALYKILDECNALLPPEHRIAAKDHFVWLNETLDRSIARILTNSTVPEELRQRSIERLRQQKVRMER